VAAIGCFQGGAAAGVIRKYCRPSSLLPNSHKQPQAEKKSRVALAVRRILRGHALTTISARSGFFLCENFVFFGAWWPDATRTPGARSTRKKFEGYIGQIAAAFTPVNILIVYDIAWHDFFPV
jgi:hypothetical protein